MSDRLFIAHHGIKGQKWGVRRYQYEDGSLTPEGRVHYGRGEDSGRSGRSGESDGRSVSSAYINKVHKDINGGNYQRTQTFNRYDNQRELMNPGHYKRRSQREGAPDVPYGKYKTEVTVGNKADTNRIVDTLTKDVRINTGSIPESAKNSKYVQDALDIGRKLFKGMTTEERKQFGFEGPADDGAVSKFLLDTDAGRAILNSADLLNQGYTEDDVDKILETLEVLKEENDNKIEEDTNASMENRKPFNRQNSGIYGPREEQKVNAVTTNSAQVRPLLKTMKTLSRQQQRVTTDKAIRNNTPNKNTRNLQMSGTGEMIFIAHHGIKGQKWGVRNGPPYPLDSSAKASYKTRRAIGIETGRLMRESYRITRDKQQVSNKVLENTTLNIKGMNKEIDKLAKDRGINRSVATQLYLDSVLGNGTYRGTFGNAFSDDSVSLIRSLPQRMLTWGTGPLGAAISEKWNQQRYGSPREFLTQILDPDSDMEIRMRTKQQMRDLLDSKYSTLQDAYKDGSRIMNEVVNENKGYKKSK